VPVERRRGVARSPFRRRSCRSAPGGCSFHLRLLRVLSAIRTVAEDVHPAWRLIPRSRRGVQVAGHPLPGANSRLARLPGVSEGNEPSPRPDTATAGSAMDRQLTGSPNERVCSGLGVALGGWPLCQPNGPLKMTTKAPRTPKNMHKRIEMAARRLGQPAAGIRRSRRLRTKLSPTPNAA
jgi:hypothetical protein